MPSLTLPLRDARSFVLTSCCASGAQCDRLYDSIRHWSRSCGARTVRAAPCRCTRLNAQPSRRPLRRRTAAQTHRRHSRALIIGTAAAHRREAGVAAPAPKPPPPKPAGTDLNEANFDKFNGYGESLVSDMPYDEDDEAADAVWSEVKRRPARCVHRPRWLRPRRPFPRRLTCGAR